MQKKIDAGLTTSPQLSNTQQAVKLMANHKGKLAIGAAAMLGIAIFYKWRESRMAKEDPAEYARLQRLKEAVCAAETGMPVKGKQHDYASQD